MRDDGSIVWTLGDAELIQGRPFAYQQSAAGTRTVDVRYRVMKNGEVRFELGKYDPSQTLVIDPTLTFSGYVHGGTSSETIRDVAVDTSGNMYVGGTTASNDLATAGAFDKTGATFDEGYITKLDSTGRNVVWATYVGGSHHDEVMALAVDGSGNVYATGHTISTDFPVTAGSYDPTHTCTPGVFPCLRDGFVIKLFASGSSLRYGTFLGGNGEDTLEDIGVDGLGLAHVAGTSGSTDYPITAGAFIGSHPGGSNAVHTTLNGSGTGLAYSTYLGGSGGDDRANLAVGSDGSRVVVFQTFSMDVPTVAPVQPAHHPARGLDLFVVSFGPRAAVQFATYLGGSDAEWLPSVAFGPDAAVYVESSTRSNDLPGQRNFGPFALNDILVAKLAADGQRVVYASRIGGSQHEEATDIVVDGYGRAITTGNTYSPDFPTTTNALKRVPSATDSFLIVLSGGGAPTYSTLIGGSRHDLATALARASSSSVLIAGTTNSRSFPVLNGLGPPSTMPTDGSGNEGFLAKFAIEAPGSPPPPPPPPTCSTRELVLHAVDATVRGAWQKVADASAASNTKVRHPNAGAARVTTPLATPVNYFELTFRADAGVNYRMWIRGRADSNSWQNDSAYIQFSNSVTSTGAATWRIGTTSATTYTLENCVNCPMSGWGWNDNDYGGVNLGAPVRFATTGTQKIRIQTREDGLAVDQIVLSAVGYFNSAPGAVRDDTTRLPKCTP